MSKDTKSQSSDVEMVKISIRESLLDALKALEANSPNTCHTLTKEAQRRTFKWYMMTDEGQS